MRRKHLIKEHLAWYIEFHDRVPNKSWRYKRELKKAEFLLIRRSKRSPLILCMDYRGWGLI